MSVNAMYNPLRLSNHERDEKRLEMYKQGMSDDEIAEVLNMTRGSISCWRSRNHLPLNKKKESKRPMTLTEFAKMARDRGMTYGQLQQLEREGKL